MSLLRRWLLILVVVSIGTSCVANSENPSKTEKISIIYGLANDMRGIDPHINRSYETGIILRQLYDTLVYRHPETLEFVPGLAANWQISDDGLRYVFNLKQNVIFHDGTPMNAQAIAENFERIFSPETGSQATQQSLGPLIQYQVIDTYTIQLILAEPFAPLLDALSQPFAAIASPTALTSYSYLRYQYHQIGTGPFRLIEYLPGDRIVIERNYNYTWGPEFYIPRSENSVERVEFRFFRDPSDRLEAIESKSVQIMSQIVPTDARALVGNSNVRILPIELPGTALMFVMNVNEVPTDNLSVRRALIYAANRSTMIDSAYQGFFNVAWGPLSPNTLFYTRRVQEAYGYDMIVAEQLVEQTGYIDTDGDGLRDLEGVPITLRLLVPPWQEFPRLSEFLRDQWQSLGIDIVLDPVPGETILRRAIVEETYNLAPINRGGVDPAFLSDLFSSNSERNWTGYQNDDLDEVLRQASVQSDSELRRQLYGQIQILLMNEALVLPLANQVNINAHDIHVRSLSFDATGWYPLLHNVTFNATENSN